MRFSNGTASGFGGASKAFEVTRREMSAVTTSARVLSNTMTSQLNPATGAAVSEFLSLGSVAASMGGSMAAIAGTAGVGALVIALGLFIKQAVDAEKKTRELFEALDSGDIDRMDKGLVDLNTRLADMEVELANGIAKWRILALSIAAAGTAFAGGVPEDLADQIAEIERGFRKEIAALRERRTETIEGIVWTQRDIEARKDNEAATKKHVQALKDLKEMMAQVNAETRQMAGKELADIVAAAEERATGTAGLSLAMSERRAKVISDMRTEAEKFQAALEALNELQLDAETHARAIEQLEQNWLRAVGGVNEYKATVTDAQKLAINLMDLFALQVSAGMADVIFEADNASEAFSNLAKEIGKAALQMTFLAAIRAGLKGIPGLGGFFSFQHGGTVPGPIGRPQLAVVHGGETITPPGEGAGGITIMVDARGAQRGVGPEVQRAIVAAMNQVRSEVVPIVDQNVRRGGRINSAVRR